MINVKKNNVHILNKVTTNTKGANPIKKFWSKFAQIFVS
jgi:hypothetical protein